MLSSHSQLYVPDETGFLPFLRCDPKQPLDVADIARVLARIGQLNCFWRGMVDDIPSLRKTLPEPRLPFLLDTLYRQHSYPQRKSRWGDKTPLYVRYIPQLLAIFPEAQFIHVIRDGRDASLSARAKWGKQKWYMDIYYLLRNWQRNVGAGRSAQRTLPAHQYCEITYEALVNDPEAVLRNVCIFLDERFEWGMLDHTLLAREVGGGIDKHIEAQDPVYARSLKRWQREMTTFEKRLSDEMVGDTLLTLGYKLAAVGQLSPAQRSRKAALAAKFWLTDTTRSMLYRTGILTLNRNRR
jgi:hypothetical protein